MKILNKKYVNYFGNYFLLMFETNQKQQLPVVMIDLEDIVTIK